MALTGAERERRTELDLVRAADLTLVVADYERQALLEEVPEAQVLVVGNVHEVRDRVPGPEGRDGLLFVGGFRHDPNVDGVLWFVGQVLPLIRSAAPMSS